MQCNVMQCSGGEKWLLANGMDEKKNTHTHTHTLNMSLTSPCMSITLIVSCSLLWFKTIHCMAPQLSVQLKHCAVQCNHHWCQCNKLIMLQSKVVQRQAVIPFILTKAIWHKSFCFLCMHEPMTATTNCPVGQACTPAAVESNLLHSSIFAVFFFFIARQSLQHCFWWLLAWSQCEASAILAFGPWHLFPKVE